jgi:prepilin-type N-terminal cleavage/methylation domain-containing protein
MVTARPEGQWQPSIALLDCHAPKGARDDSTGFTLIEIMVVIALIAIVMGFALPNLGIISSHNLKSAALTIAGMIRATYDRAAIKNRQYRLVFDFTENKNSVWAEYLVPEESEGTTDEEKKSEEEPVKSEKESTEKVVIAKGSYEVDDSELLEKYSLPRGVKLAGLESMHTGGEVKEGKDFILFLPNGFVEKSHIHLQGSGDTVFSLEISPLTGNTRVHEEYTPFAKEEDE